MAWKWGTCVQRTVMQLKELMARLKHQKLFSSKHPATCSQTILSSSFDAAGRQLTGLKLLTDSLLPFFQNWRDNSLFPLIREFP